MDAQIAGLRQRWEVTQVRIITREGRDIDWLQSFVNDDALFLSQLFVDAAWRRQGDGTKAVEDLIEEAARAGGRLLLGGKDQSRAAAPRTSRLSHDARGRAQVYMRHDRRVPRRAEQFWAQCTPKPRMSGLVGNCHKALSILSFRTSDTDGRDDANHGHSSAEPCSYQNHSRSPAMTIVFIGTAIGRRH
jgi:GNAT superfamily N-acetyltransferase